MTLTLAAGVPLDLVQRVTGHRTAEVVMKHYFRPGREDFRAAIFKRVENGVGSIQFTFAGRSGYCSTPIGHRHWPRHVASCSDSKCR